MTASTQREQVAKFRALHAPGNLLVLPNAWDAASARLAEELGAKAIATSSASLAWSHGYPDGQAIPVSTVLAAVAEIVRVVCVPVSVDSEAGYSDNPAKVADHVCALADLGVCGINLEDAKSPPELLATKIAAIRQTLARKGADIFVNARCDVFLHKLTAPEAAIAETIARGKHYKQAGADGFFVPAIADAAQIREVAGAVDLPLNVLARETLPPLAVLKDAGVRRFSAGSNTARAALGAARRAMKQLLDEGICDAIFLEGEGVPNMNALLAH